VQPTDREQELLASLADMPAYRLLIELFKEYEADVLTTMCKTAASDALLRRTRFYQFVRAVREFLEVQPEVARQSLSSIRAAQVEVDDPARLSAADLWFQRFSRDATGVENTGGTI